MCWPRGRVGRVDPARDRDTPPTREHISQTQGAIRLTSIPPRDYPCPPECFLLQFWQSEKLGGMQVLTARICELLMPPRVLRIYPDTMRSISLASRTSSLISHRISIHSRARIPCRHDG